MKEGIFKRTAYANYLGSSQVGRACDLSNEAIVNVISCPASERKNYRYQIVDEARPEVSEVEDSIPSTRVREPANTLESDSVVSYGWLSVCESMYNNIWEWVPAESTDISSGRIQLSATLEKDTEELPSTSEFEGIVSDTCVEFCNSRGLTPVLKICLRQIKKIFSDRKSLYAELDYFEDDFSTEDGHVAIRLEVAYDAQTSSAKYNAWINWAIDNIKPNDIGLITLTIKRLQDGAL
ncbi:MAG: hypothetical protein KAV87_66490 [Desulfobacteraceae bacterium]|nr:hypothetical protein [Desulfobacteraceae bacterium]